MSDSYYKGGPDEESRQQYANYQVQELQRYCLERGQSKTFAQLLEAFRVYGQLYDEGYRLHDDRDVAA